MADDPQPDEGQGTPDTGLFDQYLQAVPEDARDYVRPYFEDAAKNVNNRLQEAAELNKTLGPYQQVEAITQYKPDELGQLLAWHQSVTQSEEAFQSWLKDAAKEAGITPAEAVEQLETELTREQVSELTRSEIGPLQDRLEQWEFNQAVAQEDALIQGAISDIEKEHKITLSEVQRQTIYDLGMAASDDNQTLTSGHNWVKAGWDRFQEIASQAQKTFVDDKLNQPAPALKPGGIGATELPKGWEEASKRAAERVRQSAS